jgi:hypothetical protein
MERISVDNDENQRLPYIWVVQILEVRSFYFLSFQASLVHVFCGRRLSSL